MNRFARTSKKFLLQRYYRVRPLWRAGATVAYTIYRPFRPIVSGATGAGKAFKSFLEVNALLLTVLTVFGLSAPVWWPFKAKEPEAAPVKQEILQKPIAPLAKAEVEQKQAAPAEKKAPNCITDTMATVYETLTNADKPSAVARRHYRGRDICNWLATVIGLRQEDDGWRIMVETPEGLRLVMFMQRLPPFALKDKVRVGGKVGDFYSGSKDEPMLQLQAAWANPCADCSRLAKEGE